MKLSDCLEEELDWQSVITWGFWSIIVTAFLDIPVSATKVEDKEGEWNA